MKSKIKRLLALVLCLTMVLNGNVSLLASDEAAAEDQVVAEAVEEMMEEVAEDATEEITEEVAEEAIEEVAEESENVVEEVVESEIASVEVVDEEPTKELLTYTWENDGVTVEVTEKVAGAIPAGVELSVKPIVDGQEYKDVETRLQEKAENEEYEIAGFLAYDICFVDAQGNEIEPNDNVNVSINFEEAVIPEMEVAEDAELDVTVMHFEEDANGKVAEIVDMVADIKEEATVMITEAVEVEKTEFVTDSFSTFTITWTRYTFSGYKGLVANVHYGYLNGNQYIEFSDLTNAPSGISASTNAVNLHDSDYVITITGYKFKEVRLDQSGGTVAQYLKRVSRSDRVQYSNDNINYTDWATLSSETTNKDIYYIYEVDSTGGNTGDDSGEVALSPPEHHKTIEKNDDNYTLSLDVKGAVGKAKPIDLLLIVDASNSMDDNVGSTTRYQVVNNAIASMKSALTSVDSVKNGDLVINTSVVIFSGPTSQGSEKRGQTCRYGPDGDAKVAEGWTSITNFSYALTSSITNGGTNWQAGVRTGNTQLASGTGNQKYVVFLTDGDPTFRYGTSTTNLQTYGTGIGDNSNNDNYNAAVTEWSNSTALKAATSYVVDTNNTAKGQNFANAIGATYLKGSDSSTITSNFTKIAQDITLPAYTNVYIEDQLSEYVDFDESNLGFKVYAGSTLLKENEDYTYSIEGKTVRVNLLEGEKLEKDIKYTVKFNVVPSTYAYYKYSVDGGYGTSKGDANTDTNLSKITSSNLPGFRSNTRAYVGYDVGNHTGLTVDYDHPVVQVDVDTTSHTIEKKWEGRALDTLTVNLIPSVKIGDVEGATPLTAEQIAAYKLLPEMSVELNADIQWKYSWESLPTYYYYLDENETIQRVPIEYSVEEVIDPTEYFAEIKVSDDGLTTVIINTEAKQDIVVTKIWNDGGNIYNTRLDEIEFELQYKYTTEDSTKWRTYEAQSTHMMTEACAVSDNPSNWKYEIVDLPILDQNGTFEYRVVEKTDVSKVGYVASMGDNLTMVNTLQTKIVKCSSTSDDILLEGAIFKALKDDTVAYFGKSGANGEVTWYKNFDSSTNTVTSEIAVLPDGTYTLTELVAPAGYSLSEVTWTMEVNSGVLLITTANDIKELKLSIKEDGATYYVSNEALYSLPSTGGFGIYMYMIGGVMLMTFATFVLYKNRRKEVLVR